MKATSFQRPAPPYRIGATLAACALLALTGAAHAEFVPNETPVSSNTTLVDLEFSQTRAQFAWTDLKGGMWLAGVNRTTGNFEPPDGRGQLLAENTVSGLNMYLWNGPEWIGTASGEQIVYSYYLPNKKQVAANVRMASAVQNSAGEWLIKKFGPANASRMTHIVSKNQGDPNPTLSYLDPSLNHYWRNAKDESSETLMAFLPPSNKSWRFASGMRALTYALPVNGTQQVFAYMLDSGAQVQLTFDSGSKDTDRTVPWIWRAPEFNNDFVLSTVVNGNELRVYRQMQAGGAAVWTPVYSNTLPVGYQGGSPEWFVYNNKSYVFMVGYAGADEYANSVWIFNIDAAAPLMRKITPDTPALRARNDPEVFITDSGPLIYYNRYDTSVDPAHPLGVACCSEGVYRADPGLSGL